MYYVVTVCDEVDYYVLVMLLISSFIYIYYLLHESECDMEKYFTSLRSAE